MTQKTAAVVNGIASYVSERTSGAIMGNPATQGLLWGASVIGEILAPNQSVASLHRSQRSAYALGVQEGTKSMVEGGMSLLKFEDAFYLPERLEKMQLAWDRGTPKDISSVTRDLVSSTVDVVDKVTLVTGATRALKATPPPRGGHSTPKPIVVDAPEPPKADPPAAPKLDDLPQSRLAEAGQRGAAAIGLEGAGSFLNSRDVDRIAEIRSSLNVGTKRNIAYGEGHIDGKDYGEVVGVSGQTTPGVMLRGERVFETGVVGHNRAWDAEVFVLEGYARKLTPASRGTLTLVSERALCESCSDVVSQFREMFPNVNLVIRAGTGGYASAGPL